MQLFKNNAYSTLGAALTNVATTLTVATGQGDRFPVVAAPDFALVTLQDAANNIEIVKVTARTAGADSMTIVRAQEGTTARAWAIGDVVELRLTAAGLAPLGVLEGAATAADIRAKIGAVGLTGDETVAGNKTFSGNTVVSVSSTGDALRITQTGTGNALVVEDEASPDSTPFVVKSNGSVRVSASADFGLSTVTALEVNNGAGRGISITRSTADAAPPTLEFARSRAATYGQRAIVLSGDQLGQINFWGDDGVVARAGAQITAIVDGTPGSADMPTRLVFGTTADGASTPAERMRITSAGFVGIGKTPTTNLDVSGNFAASGSVSAASVAATGAVTGNNLVYLTGDQSVAGNKTYTGIQAWNGTGIHTFGNVVGSYTGIFSLGGRNIRKATTGHAIEVVNNANSAVTLTLADNGDLTASGNVTAYSDERLKTDWDVGALWKEGLVQNLAYIKAGTYTRTDTGERQIGVSAQSLRTVMPEAVLEDKDGMLSVAYGNAALAACVALAREVVQLRQRVEQLEAR